MKIINFILITAIIVIGVILGQLLRQKLEFAKVPKRSRGSMRFRRIRRTKYKLRVTAVREICVIVIEKFGFGGSQSVWNASRGSDKYGEHNENVQRVG